MSTQSCHRYRLFKNIHENIELIWLNIHYDCFITGKKYEEIPVNEVKDRVIGRIKLDMAEWFFKHIGKHFNALNTVVQQASMYMQHLCIPLKLVRTLSFGVPSTYLIRPYPASPNAT